METARGNRWLSFLLIIIMLLSLIISPMLLFAVSLCIVLVGHKGTWKSGVLGLSIAIAIFAMYTDPERGDLQRYYGTLDVIEHLDLGQTITYFNDGLFTENVFLWLIAKTGIFTLLPAISVWLVYYIAMYITGKTAEKYDQEKNIKWIILAQLLLLPLVSVAHNIRNVTAFALILLAVYRDIFLRKINLWTIVLYVFGAFMHTSAILFVLVRLLMPIIKKSYTLIVVGVAFIGVLMNLGYKYSQVFAGIPIVQKMIVKAYNYLGDSNSEYGQEIAASTLQRVLRLVFIVLTLYIVALILSKSFSKKRLKIDERAGYWMHFLFFVCMFVLFCCIQYTTPAYWRFFTMVSLSISTVLLPVHTGSGSECLLKTNHYYGIVIFGLGATALNLYTIVSNYDTVEWVMNFIINKDFNVFNYFLGK